MSGGRSRSVSSRGFCGGRTNANPGPTTRAAPNASARNGSRFSPRNGAWASTKFLSRFRRICPMLLVSSESPSLDKQVGFRVGVATPSTHHASALPHCLAATSALPTTSRCDLGSAEISSSVRQRLRRNFGEPKKSFLAPLQGERSIATQALRPRRCLLCCDFAERSRDREFGLSLDISIIRHVSILARQRPGATSGWMEFSPCWRSGCIGGGRLGGWCRWGRCGAWRRSLRRCLHLGSRGYRPGLGTRT